MNRATASVGPRISSLPAPPGGRSLNSNSVETVNRNGRRAFIYVRRKVFFVILELRWFLKQPRDVKRVIPHPSD